MITQDAMRVVEMDMRLSRARKHAEDLRQMEKGTYKALKWAIGIQMDARKVKDASNAPKKKAQEAQSLFSEAQRIIDEDENLATHANEVIQDAEQVIEHANEVIKGAEAYIPHH